MSCKRCDRLQAMLDESIAQYDRLWDRHLTQWRALACGFEPRDETGETTLTRQRCIELLEERLRIVRSQSDSYFNPNDSITGPRKHAGFL